MGLQLSLVLACGVIALLYGGWLVQQLLALSPGTKEMQEIASAIQEGARAYLNRQYTTVAIVGVVIFIAAFIVLGWQVAVGFLIGSTLSGSAGYVGMNVSVRGNVRTAQASRIGLAQGLSVAFLAGPGTGLLVVGLRSLRGPGHLNIFSGSLWLSVYRP